MAPDDATHLVARTTLGLLDSRDGGKSGTWICEGAVVYTDFEPPLAVAAGGTTLLSLTEGIVRSPNGCAWGSADRALVDRDGGASWTEIFVGAGLTAAGSAGPSTMDP
ncbi:MAG: hypothetical protein KC731_10245, partial [Myxococcales bacterium]|nr:hypothetical protein [Myxococcales bacterium]